MRSSRAELPPATPRLAAGTAGATAAVVMWGAASVMAKSADVDGLTLAFHRLWVGAAAMVVIYALRGGWVRPRLLWAAFPGGVAFAADITLFFIAVKHTTVAKATIQLFTVSDLPGSCKL